jgi:hypothetical protein
MYSPLAQRVFFRRGMEKRIIHYVRWLIPRVYLYAIMQMFRLKKGGRKNIQDNKDANCSHLYAEETKEISFS